VVVARWRGGAVARRPRMGHNRTLDLRQPSRVAW
jgi:hypothetical protein